MIIHVQSSRRILYLQVKRMASVTAQAVRTKVGEIQVPDYSTRPDYAWSKLQVKQTVKTVKPLSHSKKKKDGYTRFVCISDTHSKTDNLELPDGDVLVHAGDFSLVGKPGEVDKFCQFLQAQPFTHKVVIAGNHDLTFDTANYDTLYRRFGHPTKYNCEELKTMLASIPSVTYLEDSGTTINGISIWGSPWQPEFCDWAFNLPRGQPCLDKWDLIPDQVDVLITHGPPLGHGDLCKNGGRAGCLQLLDTIQQRVRPQYHVYGHIHEGYGMTTDGQTVYVNASTCTYNYRPTNKPIIFDLPNK